MSNSSPRYATLRDYLRVLRDQRWIILLMILVGAGVALLVSAQQETKYQATSAISFQDAAQQSATLLGTGGGSATPPEQTPQSRSQQIIAEPEVLERVQRSLAQEITLRKLQDSITTDVDPTSYLVRATATWPKPEFAATLANEFAREAESFTNKRARKQFKEAADNVRRRLNRLGDNIADQTERVALTDQLTRLEFLASNAVAAKVVKESRVPDSPASPQPVRNAMLGALFGLILGTLVAFMRDSLDRRLHGARDIQQEMGYPLLGHVRDIALGHVIRNRSGESDLIFSDDLEAFRILRQNLEFLAADAPLRSILVTSPLPEEGKSTVAGSLACALAVGGKRTLLVECDLRRPALASRLGFAASPGLTDYLAGHADPRDILQTINLVPPELASAGNGGDPTSPDGASLVCIAAGTWSPQPAELLGSDRFRDFIEKVSKVYDMVLLDTSPLLPVADTLEILPLVDGVLVCVRSGQTTREQAHAAKAALDHFPARPTGVVVTGLRPQDGDAYEYYAYGYANTPPTRTSAPPASSAERVPDHA